MKANRIPVTTRLRNRISRLEYLEDSIWVKSSRGNPYLKCKGCEIHQPQYSINNDRHYTGCQYQGLTAEIRHYKWLLAEALLTCKSTPAVA